jgi:hypothetical protein
MSGKRHHFVPRFLQSGFASHTNGNEVFTWVYRKGAKRFNTNTVNVGVEGQFYSQDGDNQVDDNITMAEGRYSALVEALCNGREDAVSNSMAIAELLAHLEIRTRHLRESFSMSASFLMKELLRFFEDEQAFGKYVQLKLRNDPSILRNAIIEELKSSNPSDSTLEEVLKASQPMFDQILPSLLSNLSSTTNHLRAAIPQMVKAGSKSGHIKALLQALAPPLKTDVYAKLKFRVLHAQDAIIPLGDSMLVFQLEGERTFKPFSEKGDQIHAVYLPLSSNRVLVGSANDAILDISQLPTVIAQCSLEYFIGSSESAGNDLLHSRIGEFAYILSQEQIGALIEDMTKSSQNN